MTTEKLEKAKKARIKVAQATLYRLIRIGSSVIICFCILAAYIAYK